jgi:hypothetical protein
MQPPEGPLDRAVAAVAAADRTPQRREPADLEGIAAVAAAVVARLRTARRLALAALAAPVASSLLSILESNRHEGNSRRCAV